MQNVPIRGIAGWLLSIALSLVVFFFWQNKEANDKLMDNANAATAKAEKESGEWKEKYFKCQEQNSVIELYKQFGVLPGRKTLSIVPKESDHSQNPESYEN